MKIEEFVQQFDDIIPYKFDIKLGNSSINEVKKDKSKASSKNFKGKMYPYYKKEITGTAMDYIPMEEVNVPIKLSIQCDYPHRLKWEKFSKTTSKEFTELSVRLLKENEDRQIGYVSLQLNQSGDLKHKFCSYCNENRTREIMQSVFYHFNENTKSVSTSETLHYIFYNLETGMEEQVEFHKWNGVLQGVTIHNEKLKNPIHNSIVWSQGNVDEKEFMFSRCFSERLLIGKKPDCDVMNSIINEDFIYRRNRIKELHSLMKYEKDEKINYGFNFKSFKQELRELLNSKNDIFGTFVGDYIGNTIIKKDGKLLLVVETVKDNLYYFTPIDITNTNAFDVDIYGIRCSDTLYYNAIRNSAKIPMFRIKIENGEEILIPFRETLTEEEIQSFRNFKSYCLESFIEIENKRLSTLSLKQNKNIEPNEGPTLRKKKKEYKK